MPAETCCGFASLRAGVLVICMLHLATCIIVITLSSSHDALKFAGMEVPALIQTMNAALCFLGIPIIIAAVVGLFYRIETNLRIYQMYLIVCFVFMLALIATFAASGSICHAYTPEETQQTARFQNHFSCSFSDGFFFFWVTTWFFLLGYFIYIVKSAGDQMGVEINPEMLRHFEKMSSAPVPPPQRSMFGGYAHPGFAPSAAHPQSINYGTVQTAQPMQSVVQQTLDPVVLSPTIRPVSANLAPLAPLSPKTTRQVLSPTASRQMISPSATMRPVSPQTSFVPAPTL